MITRAPWCSEKIHFDLKLMLINVEVQNANQKYRRIMRRDAGEPSEFYCQTITRNKPTEMKMAEEFILYIAS